MRTTPLKEGDDMDSKWADLVSRHEGIRRIRKFYRSDLDAVEAWVFDAQDRLNDIETHVSLKLAPRLERQATVLRKVAAQSPETTAVRIGAVADEIERTARVLRRTTSQVKV
jgi:hypothetical protein